MGKPNEEWLIAMAAKEAGKCISVGGLLVDSGLYVKPEWPGDIRDPSAGCWHEVDSAVNSTVSDPVHCRQPVVAGTKYCKDHQRK